MQINLVFSLEEILLIYVINGFFWGIICHFVAKTKNNSGFWWGFLLGLIGLIVVACASPKEQELNYEKQKFDDLDDDKGDTEANEELINETATMLKRCPQCGAEMQASLNECYRCGYCFDKKANAESEEIKEKTNWLLTALKIIGVALICGFLGFLIPMLITNLTTPVYVVPTYTPSNTSNTNNTNSNKSSAVVTRKDINDYVENRVLYEDDNIAVTITHINGLDTFSFQLKNKSEKDLTFRLDAVAINNCIIKGLFNDRIVTAGNSIVVNYDLNGLDSYQIKEIKAIDFKVSCYGDNYGDLVAEAMCHATIKGYENYEPAFNIEYPLVYEDDYLAVYLVKKGSKCDDIVFLYYNKSDEFLAAVGAQDIALNGIMMDLYFNKYGYYNMLPHCMIYTNASDGTISLTDYISTELEEKGIKSIEKMECKFGYTLGEWEYIKSKSVVVFE